MNYYNPKKPASFTGHHSFSKVAKNSKNWLQSQDVYTLHKSVRRRFPRRKTIVPGAKFQFQADLIDFSALKNYNKNYKYILVVVDVFTKMAYAACLKSKTGDAMIKAFQSVLEKTGHFTKLQTDRGSEFLNRSFKTWLKKQNIELFHSHNYDTKAAIVERFIRTLKDKLWRYFTYTNSRNYVDVLPELLHSYNHTYHTSIKRTPASVNAENQEEVWLTLYGDVNMRKPKLKIGDKVRISKNRRAFAKSHLPGWTEELFIVHQAYSGDPPFYKIKDLNNEILDGTFYAEELQKIYKTDGIFKIESILKKRKRKKQQEYLVKWSGYPATFNSWIPAKQLVYYA